MSGIWYNFLVFVGGFLGTDDYDVALDWNKVILEANIIDHNYPEDPLMKNGRIPTTRGPVASARVLAMTHLAMFEAYNVVTNQKFEPYYPEAANIQGNGASLIVACAAAVHGVMNGVDDLTGLYVHDEAITNFVNQALQNTISREILGQAIVNAGLEVGRQVATLVLKDRANDGYAPDNDFLLDVKYNSTLQDGDHRPDPMNPIQGYLSAGAGMIPPFGMDQDTLDAFRAPSPPSLENGVGNFNASSEDYTESLEQVRIKGVWRGGNESDPIADTTDDETYVMANFWSANGSPDTGTPTTMYNDIARKIAIERGNTFEDNIKLFTILNLGIANAGISSWQSKFYWRLWRPVVAIRNDPRPEVVDADWTPLGASRSNPHNDGERNFSPPFPGHTSGHATFGCAAFQTIANFYGTHEIPFSYTGVEWNGKTLDMYGRTRPCLVREYTSLIDAAAENAASRVFNGVHFDFEGTMGCEAGKGIANNMWENLYPLSGDTNTGRTAVEHDFDNDINDVLDTSTTTGYDAVKQTCAETPPYPYVGPEAIEQI